MNKICILYTGGTIGMVSNQQGILIPPKDPQDFLKIAPEINQLADIDFFLLMNKDSTNIHPQDWQKMARAIYNKRNEGYHGFVIIHGTDTLHFSASAIAFALGDRLNFPVVFTGAQTIANVLHGDAKINLIRAVAVALSDLAEVVICFADQVFRGCRTNKIDEQQFVAFASPACPPVARIMEKIQIHPQAIQRNHAKAGEIILRDQFASDILQINLIPGLTVELLMPLLEQNQCKALILQSFGAGNISNEADETGDYRLHLFIEKATARQIPVIIISPFAANSTLNSHYQTAVKALEAGAINTGNMTATATSTKVRWVLAQVEQAIIDKKIKPADKLKHVEEMMKIIYVHEMDE